MQRRDWVKGDVFQRSHKEKIMTEQKKLRLTQTVKGAG